MSGRNPIVVCRGRLVRGPPELVSWTGHGYAHERSGKRDWGAVAGGAGGVAGVGVSVFMGGVKSEITAFRFHIIVVAFDRAAGSAGNR